MTLPWTHIHVYRCAQCKLYATSPVKGVDINSYSCARCRQWLKFLYSIPITTEADRALADRGLVHSPGVDRPPLPTCGVCHDVLGSYAVALPDGTPCHYRCSPAYQERKAEHRAEQQLLNEERQAALEGTKEQNSV